MHQKLGRNGIGMGMGIESLGNPHGKPLGAPIEGTLKQPSLMSQIK